MSATVHRKHSLAEGCNDIGKLFGAKRHRRIDPQPAAGVGGKPGHHAFCIRDIFEYLPAAFIVGLPGLSETDTPGGSVQQAPAQAVFQRRDMFAGGCPGKLQLFCGGRKAALIDDRHKYRHAGKSVHVSASIRTIVSILETIISYYGSLLSR